MITIDEYTKEQILDFTWVNPNTDYILTDYYWQKFRKSVNPEFTTKKGSRKRYYSESVYTKFCLWLVDLDISRAKNTRRKILQEIKEKLNEQMEEMYSSEHLEIIKDYLKDRPNENIVDSYYKPIKELWASAKELEEVQKQREEIQKQREEVQRMDYLREHLEEELKKVDIRVQTGELSVEEGKQLRRSLTLQSYVRIPETEQKLLDDVKLKLKERNDQIREKEIKVEIERKMAIEYKSGRMTRPTLYVKVDLNNFWSQMFRWKIGWTTDLERREENSVTDNPDLKLWLTLEFETMEEAVNEEHKLHEYYFGLERRIDQQRPKKYANTNCKEFFYLTKTMLEDLKNKYNWKEYLTIKEIYDTRRK